MTKIQYKPASVEEMEAILIIAKDIGYGASGCNDENKAAMAEEWFKHYPYLIFTKHNKSFGGNSSKRIDSNNAVSIINADSAADLFVHLLVGIIKKVRLNDEHTAVVSREGIQVGCQAISFEAFDELASAVKEVRNK